MKFGVLLLLSWPDRRVPIETVYARALERVEIMDRTGYDAVWLAEHHFTEYSVCPSVHLMALLAAERSERLRIGTGISLVPFYDPVRLAEEVAMLDVLSGGRVNWGAGRGYQRAEYEAFGVPPRESYARFREGLSVVIEAWTRERLTFHGEFSHYDDVEVLPKPRQKPHPPVWLAASSAEAITWAGRAGHSILLDPVGTHEQIRRKRVLYRECLEAGGHAIAGRDLPVARLIAVGETDAAAEEVARAGARWYLGTHARPGHRPVDAGSELNRRRSDLGDLAETFQSTEASLERFVREAVIHGAPERCIAEIERLREEIPLDYLLCAPLGHRAFMGFTEKVLPHFL